MTKLNKLSIALALASGVIVSSPAIAFSFGGYSGPVTFVLSGVDEGTLYQESCGTALLAPVNAPGTDATCDGSAVLAAARNSMPNEDAYGLFQVTAILELVNGTTPGATLWAPTATEKLIGVFGGLEDVGAFVTASGGFGGTTFQQQTVSTGGFVEMYLTTDLTAYLAAVSAGATGITRTGTGGIAGISDVLTPMLTGEFNGASIFGLPSDQSYQNTFNQNSYSLVGTGFLDFTGGTHLDMFAQGGVLDMNLNPVDAGIGIQNQPGAGIPTGWTTGFTGNVQTNVIPEPASLALLGLGLIGLAAMRRRA